MLQTLFNEYKWTALGVLLLAYSIGVWHVSSGYTDNAYNKERLRHSEEIIRIKVENEEALTKLTEEWATLRGELEQSAKKSQKELLDELAKDNRYSICRVTDGVRDVYKRKLQTQR